MKYKLINNQTGEEHLCEKVTIDGWDYYVSENYKDGDYVILPISLSLAKCVNGTTFIEGTQKVIATNNPNIDVPQVVDEVEILAEKFIGCKYEDIEDSIDQIGYDSFKRGYNKSQETHPNSDDDMVEFAIFYEKNQGKSLEYWGKDLFKIWKEQRPKTLYYE